MERDWLKLEQPAGALSGIDIDATAIETTASRIADLELRAAA